MIKKQINSTRAERIASKVQTLVAEILRTKFAEDALIFGVSLVGAKASRNFQFVRLFYYSHNEDIKKTQEKLDEITKSVRFELAQRLNQKYVPEIRFTYDDTLEKAGKIEEILSNLPK